MALSKNELPKKFFLLRRRQTARLRDDSRSEENIETSEVVSTNEPVRKPNEKREEVVSLKFKHNQFNRRLTKAVGHR